jgi:hypothetical protein
MKEYEIRIEEILQRTINVEAENKEEAIEKVKEMYRNEEVVLTADDFAGVEFK